MIKNPKTALRFGYKQSYLSLILITNIQILLYSEENKDQERDKDIAIIERRS